MPTTLYALFKHGKWVEEGRGEWERLGTFHGLILEVGGLEGCMVAIPVVVVVDVVLGACGGVPTKQGEGEKWHGTRWEGQGGKVHTPPPFPHPTKPHMVPSHSLALLKGTPLVPLLGGGGLVEHSERPHPHGGLVHSNNKHGEHTLLALMHTLLAPLALVAL